MKAADMWVTNKDSSKDFQKLVFNLKKNKF